MSLTIDSPKPWPTPFVVNPDLPTLFISVFLSYVFEIVNKRQSSLSFNSTSISFSFDFKAASIALLLSHDMFSNQNFLYLYLLNFDLHINNILYYYPPFYLIYDKVNL